MKWKIEYNSTLRIIEVVYTGSNTASDLRESTSKAIALSKEQGNSRCLVDAAEIKLTATVFDLYNLPDQYREEGLERSSRIALVLPKAPKEREEAQFYQTTCLNRGWVVQVFSDRQSAVDWLTSSTTTKKSTGGDY